MALIAVIAPILIVAAVAVALYLAGAAVPDRTTIRLFLWDRLQAAGLAAEVPAACARDLADLVSLRPSDPGVLPDARWQERVEAIVDSAAGWMRDGREPLDPTLRAAVEILSRYGCARADVPRGHLTIVLPRHHTRID